MAFTTRGALSLVAAHRRFDELLASSVPGLESRGKQAVILQARQHIIGYCGTEEFVLNGQVQLELGYRLMPEFRGKGLATEAALAVLSASPEKTLFAYVDEENVKSQQVLQRIGFTACGVYGLENKTYHLWRIDSPRLTV